MKAPKNDLAQTNILIIPADWDRFMQLGRAEGTTASAMIRGFIQRELRRAERQAAR